MSQRKLTFFLAAVCLGLCFWPAESTRGQARLLDLSRYTLTFADEFSAPPSVSSWGPGTRWIAHTPWHGDFGDAVFAEPAPGFPFTAKGGRLRIEARQFESAEGKKSWRSGLLASCDEKGRGFSQQYGYFEMSAKLPAGKGVWPAFWLASTAEPPSDPREDGQIEVDVLEYYGFAGLYNVTVHTWKPEPHEKVESVVAVPGKSESTRFHKYGVDVSPEAITVYLDRVEVWRAPTPKAHRRKLMVLLNLALGGGWPIDMVKSPTFMEVDYVRAYAPK